MQLQTLNFNERNIMWIYMWIYIQDKTVLLVSLSVNVHMYLYI